jgi:hypothetical protein
MRDFGQHDVLSTHNLDESPWHTARVSDSVLHKIECHYKNNHHRSKYILGNHCQHMIGMKKLWGL